MKFCIVLLAAALALTASAAPPGQMLADAVALHRQGNLAGAAERYLEYLKTHPDSLEARTNLGAAYAGMGRMEDAAGQYRKALEIAPHHKGVRLNLALAYYKQAHLDSAVQELLAARALDPSDRQITLLLADSYLRLGENGQVIALLEPLDQSTPGDLASAYLLGTALIRDRRAGQGQLVIDRILKGGESAEGHLLIGASQLGAGDHRGALASLGRAVELNPKVPGLMSLYGRAKLEDGDPAAARQAFEKELQTDPYDYDANLHLGALLRLERDHERAAPLLERALQIRPTAAGARFQAASLRLETGRVNEAREMFEKLVEDSPHFTEAHIALTTAYYRLKRKEDGDRHRIIVQKLNEESQQKELKDK